MEADLKKAAFAALNVHLEQHAGDLLENCRQIQQTLSKMDWASIATDNDKMVKRVLRFVWGVFSQMRDRDRLFCEKSVDEVASVFANGLNQAHENFQRHAAYLKEQRENDLEQAHVASAIAVQAEQIKWTAERDMWIQRAVHTVETKYEEKIKILVVEHTKSYDKMFLQLNSSEASLKKTSKDLAQAAREKSVLEQGMRDLEKEVSRLQHAVSVAEANAAAAAANPPVPLRAPVVVAATPTPKPQPPVVAAAPKPVPKADSALQTSLFNEKEFKSSVLADYELKLQRVKNDFISRHEIAMRVVLQEKDTIISQLSDQLVASEQSCKDLSQKHKDDMARIAELLKSNADIRARLLEAQQQQRPAIPPKPPRDLTISLFTQFQPPVATCDVSVQCEDVKPEVKSAPVAEKKHAVALKGAACQTDALIVPISPRGYKSLGIDRVTQWAATQTLDSDDAQRQKQKDQLMIEGLQNTIKKLEGDVASQQMLCESLAKSFADQIGVMRRFGDVHSGSSNTVCGRPHLCILCFRNPVKSVSFPCGHSAICNRCRTMHALDRCPQCAPPPQLQAAVKHMEAHGGAGSWVGSATEEGEAAAAAAADAIEHIPAIHPRILKQLPPNSAWLGQQPDGSVHVTGWRGEGVKTAATERPPSAASTVFPDATLFSFATPHQVFSTTPTRMVRVLAGRTAAGKVQPTLAAPTGVSTESPFKVTSMKRNQGLSSLIQAGIAAASAAAPAHIPTARPKSSHAMLSQSDAAAPLAAAAAAADAVLVKRPSSAVPKYRS
jgi:hypothetical protein